MYLNRRSLLSEKNGIDKYRIHNIQQCLQTRSLLDRLIKCICDDQMSKQGITNYQFLREQHTKNVAQTSQPEFTTFLLSSRSKPPTIQTKFTVVLVCLILLSQQPSAVSLKQNPHRHDIQHQQCCLILHHCQLLLAYLQIDILN